MVFKFWSHKECLDLACLVKVGVYVLYLTLSRSTSVINIPNSEHIHASDKYILSFISVRSFANKKGLIKQLIVWKQMTRLFVSLL